MTQLDPSYLTRPDTNRTALEFRLRCVNARLATLDKALGDREPRSERDAALSAERNSLRGIKHEVEAILGTKVTKRPKAPKDTRQLQQLSLLRSSIYQRSRDTYGFADKLEREADFRNARIHRLNAIYFGEQIAAEYKIPVELLAFCDPPKIATVVAEPSEPPYICGIGPVG